MHNSCRLSPYKQQSEPSIFELLWACLQKSSKYEVMEIFKLQCQQIRQRRLCLQRLASRHDQILDSWKWTVRNQMALFLTSIPQDLQIWAARYFYHSLIRQQCNWCHWLFGRSSRSKMACWTDVEGRQGRKSLFKDPWFAADCVREAKVCFASSICYTGITEESCPSWCTFLTAWTAVLSMLTPQRTCTSCLMLVEQNTASSKWNDPPGAAIRTHNIITAAGSGLAETEDAALCFCDSACIQHCWRPLVISLIQNRDNYDCKLVPKSQYFMNISACHLTIYNVQWLAASEKWHAAHIYFSQGSDDHETAMLLLADDTEFYINRIDCMRLLQHSIKLLICLTHFEYPVNLGKNAGTHSRNSPGLQELNLSLPSSRVWGTHRPFLRRIWVTIWKSKWLASTWLNSVADWLQIKTHWLMLRMEIVMGQRLPLLSVLKRALCRVKSQAQAAMLHASSLFHLIMLSFTSMMSSRQLLAIAQTCTMYSVCFINPINKKATHMP